MKQYFLLLLLLPLLIIPAFAVSLPSGVDWDSFCATKQPDHATTAADFICELNIFQMHTDIIDIQTVLNHITSEILTIEKTPTMLTWITTEPYDKTETLRFKIIDLEPFQVINWYTPQAPFPVNTLPQTADKDGEIIWGLHAINHKFRIPYLEVIIYDNSTGREILHSSVVNYP